MTAQHVVFAVALILTTGLVSRLAADLLRMPQTLLLLGAGVLLGPNVTGELAIPFGSIAAETILTLGVSFILFHGGLQLSVDVLRRVATGLAMLVVPGVLLTTAVTGVAAAAIFGIPLWSGLLVGAVLSPTDPAILIPLFERLRIAPKVSQTIIAESAFNDPIGAVLGLTLLGVVVGDGASLGGPVLEFLKQLAIATAIGVAAGCVVSLVVSNRRFGIWSESAAVAVLAVVAVGYFAVGELGGSGYLGVFLAGVIVGNMDRLGLSMHAHHATEMRSLIKVVAEITVMFVFILLGANLPWRAIIDRLPEASAVIAVLIFVARPIAVAACLLPDRRGRWTGRELIFISWTRETGVLPAALASIVVERGAPVADIVVTTVAVAVVVTLGLQATSKRWLASLLWPPGKSAPHVRRQKHLHYLSRSCRSSSRGADLRVR